MAKCDNTRSNPTSGRRTSPDRRYSESLATTFLRCFFYGKKLFLRTRKILSWGRPFWNGRHSERALSNVHWAKNPTAWFISRSIPTDGWEESRLRPTMAPRRRFSWRIGVRLESPNSRWRHKSRNTNSNPRLQGNMGPRKRSGRQPPSVLLPQQSRRPLSTRPIFHNQPVSNSMLWEECHGGHELPTAVHDKKHNSAFMQHHKNLRGHDETVSRHPRRRQRGRGSPCRNMGGNRMQMPSSMSSSLHRDHGKHHPTAGSQGCYASSLLRQQLRRSYRRDQLFHRSYALRFRRNPRPFARGVFTDSYWIFGIHNPLSRKLRCLLPHSSESVYGRNRGEDSRNCRKRGTSGKNSSKDNWSEYCS